jgi:hypothetical protein
MNAKKKKNRSPPAVDLEYFHSGYQEMLQTYFSSSYREADHLSYLHSGGSDRGKAYKKYAPALYKLGKEFLCPENFASYNGKLFRWKCTMDMPEPNYNGMDNLVDFLQQTQKMNEEEDWHLPAGVSLTMCLRNNLEELDERKWNWTPWVRIGKSSVVGAGNGLFAAREFETGETIGFYVGYVFHRHHEKWTEMMSDGCLMDQRAFLNDEEGDSRTIQSVDTEGCRVLVNPHHGSDKEKLWKLPLFMGIHFINDFNKVCDESLKDKTNQFNNVWSDDQGGMKASKRITKGTELFLAYERNGNLLKAAEKPVAVETKKRVRPWPDCC